MTNLRLEEILDKRRRECIVSAFLEYKITRLSNRPCKEQLFSLEQKNKDDAGEFQTIEVIVYDYFINSRNIDLPYSTDLPCINVGKPKRPTYFPIEACMMGFQKFLNNKRSSSISDNGATEPARILLERWFAQTQKLKEQIGRDPHSPLVTELGL
ncbi:unnamed protein product [Fraxinus pennsylvanica]|uniref:PAZ domain-containing protein n=1 Tax=Fraxinus pennsylvanica TaxID=56036 RepID=A0AAD2A2C9_9LAMI|nr:unnamed protein product [Fraxinus pennsylvanica]